MIQRIQSLYLFLLFIANGIGILINTSVFSKIDKGFTQLDVLTIDILFISTAIILMLLSLITVFKYKKRVLQMRFCQFMILSNIVFVVIIGVYVYWQLSLPGGFSYPEKGIEWVIALISIVFAILAKKAIKSDDELVKSADRFR